MFEEKIHKVNKSVEVCVLLNGFNNNPRTCDLYFQSSSMDTIISMTEKEVRAFAEWILKNTKEENREELSEDDKEIILKAFYEEMDKY